MLTHNLPAWTVNFIIMLDKARKPCVIYPDRAEEFYRVFHSALLARLMGRRIALSWFKAQTFDSQKAVSVDGELSHPFPVTNVVNQESVLGPYTFLPRGNEVFTIVQCRTRFLFADDIKILWAPNWRT